MTTTALSTMKIRKGHKARTHRRTKGEKADAKRDFIAAIRAKIERDGDAGGRWAARIVSLETELAEMEA